MRTANVRPPEKGPHTPAVWPFAIVYLALTLLFFLSAALSDSLKYPFYFINYGGTFRWHHFSLGSLSVSLYWLMHGVGLLGMILLCVRRAPAASLGVWQAVSIAVLLAVSGYVGAKLLYIVENWQKVLQTGLELSGVSFFGTVFFMPLALWLMAHLYRRDVPAFMDYCTPAGLVMLTAIRTGCFLNGCCRGITVWFGSRPVTLPSQLLECTLDLVLLELIFRLEEKKLFCGRRYGVFMGGYGLIRFAVEFTRATPKQYAGLSGGGWFAVISFLIGFAVCLPELRRICSQRKNRPQEVRRGRRK